MSDDLNPTHADASGAFLVYTSFGSNIDLVAAKGHACRAIRSDSACTLSVISLAGDTVALKFAAGETRMVRCTQINAAGTSGATDITVYW